MISRPKIQAFLGTYQEGAEKFPVHLQLRPGVDPSSIFLTGSSGSGKSTAGQSTYFKKGRFDDESECA